MDEQVGAGTATQRDAALFRLDTTFAVVSLLFAGAVTLGLSPTPGSTGPSQLVAIAISATFIGLVGLIVASTVWHAQKGVGLKRAIPTGDGWGLVGAIVVVGVLSGEWLLVGRISVPRLTHGIGDPTLVVLGSAIALLLASPLRAAWYRAGPTPTEDAPIVVSAGLVLAAMALIMTPINPLAEPLIMIDSVRARALGPVGLAAHPIMLLTGACVLARGCTVPRGTVVVLFVGPGIVSVAMHGYHELLLASIGAGLLGELILGRRDDPWPNQTEIRLFGVVVPLCFGLCYLAVAAVTTGLAWPGTHWSGAVLAGSIGGLAATFATNPSRPPRT